MIFKSSIPVMLLCTKDVIKMIRRVIMTYYLSHERVRSTERQLKGDDYIVRYSPQERTHDEMCEDANRFNEGSSDDYQGQQRALYHVAQEHIGRFSCHDEGAVYDRGRAPGSVVSGPCLRGVALRLKRYFHIVSLHFHTAR